MGDALAGKVIVTTRSDPGRLDELLATAGATVVHVPLTTIEPVGAPDLALDGAAWLVVTSQHGARAVGGRAAQHPGVRLAAVGTRTAKVLAELAGRPVDVIPDRQTAADLAEAFPRGSGRVVAALGDRAGTDLVVGLQRKSWHVETRVVYHTHLAVPDPAVRLLLLQADAVAFASGSAATAWAQAVGTDTPPVVVAIGPTTRDAAEAAGVAITHVAATHDIDGLVAAVVGALASEP